MRFSESTILGRTGLKVGKLGISSSYGAPTEAYLEAFNKGCNYFTWGTFIKGKSKQMKEAIKQIIKDGKRADLVLAIVTYAHNAFLTRFFLKRALKALGTNYTDILLLGYYSKRPRKAILNDAIKLKKEGLIKHIGVTGHNRNIFPILAKEETIDVFHVRYNAANNGAEQDIFPHLSLKDKPGIVAFTATKWGQLLKEKKMPPGQKPLSATDYYRFVLSNKYVDVCMTGTKNLLQMRENLEVLNSGPLTKEEMEHIRKIGDYVYGR